MKKTLALIAMLLTSAIAFSQQFVKINVENLKDTERLFDNPNLKIHYYNDSFVIATALDGFNTAQKEVIVLDNEAFAGNDAYYIIYCDKENQDSYISNVKENLQVLYGNDNLLIVKPIEGITVPFKNDGVVAVFDKEAKLPVVTRDYPVITEENLVIREMMNQVDMDSLEATVQFLQDYGERMFNGTHIAQAREWVKGRMEALGLETEVQEFHVNSWMGSATCYNLIGIQRGTLYPDTYVVCGSHYDSFSYESYSHSGLCPGADDNATGTAAVLESARILTQYEFEYSIIYCVFSAEECGLYGSEAYADRCASEGMEILGYFNNDMNGYLNPGDEIHIDCIYPNSVEPIGAYYMNVGSVYFPEMQIQHVNLDYGDSDHTSFNNVGYMGIYPFEDVNHKSPYIHTSEDLIGNSVNSFEMSQRYTQMNIGCLTELANPISGASVTDHNAPSDFNFEIYPNPATEMLTIINNSNIGTEVEIVNMVGQVVKRFEISDKKELNVSDLESGVYFVKMNGVSMKLIIR
ncbi:MAG: M28 family peptidase [Bacteroidales bacterium]|nr:M28 family peptidase [Bacteroidales bacterium]